MPFVSKNGRVFVLDFENKKVHLENEMLGFDEIFSILALIFREWRIRFEIEKLKEG